MAPVIFSVATFILAILLICPETAFRIAEWCSRPISNIIFPSEELSKPPLSYVLARRYKSSARLEEAVAEYEQIIHFYPKEVDAYVELLEVAGELGDEKLQHKYSRLFEKRFKRKLPETRETSSLH